MKMDMKTKLARITEISITRPEEKFTSIYHLINKDLLMICHNELEKNIEKAITQEEKRDCIKQFRKEYQEDVVVEFLKEVDWYCKDWCK